MLKHINSVQEFEEEVKEGLVLVDFFATWCPPCRAELPAFDAAHQNYGDKINFLILDLVDSGNESVQNGLDFVAANGYGFPLFFDSLGEGYGAYGTGYVPVTVLIRLPTVRCALTPTPRHGYAAPSPPESPPPAPHTR